MKHPSTRERALIASFVLLLGAMAVLGGPARPPLVPISKLSSVDPGSDVRIEGLLVDLWTRDDGSEALVLLDPRTDDTAKVFCSRGVRGQPSAYACIGDLVQVRGEASGTSFAPTIFTESDDIAVVCSAEYVLTVTVLARNWLLFEGDRFSITGVLEFDPGSGCVRLYDSGMRGSIELRYDGMIQRLTGETVTVDCNLRFDPSMMSLYLAAESISSSS